MITGGFGTNLGSSEGLKVIGNSEREWMLGSVPAPFLGLSMLVRAWLLPLHTCSGWQGPKQGYWRWWVCLDAWVQGQGIQASAIGSLMSMTLKSYLSTEHKQFSQKLEVLATMSSNFIRRRYYCRPVRTHWGPPNGRPLWCRTGGGPTTSVGTAGEYNYLKLIIIIKLTWPTPALSSNCRLQSYPHPTPSRLTHHTKIWVPQCCDKRYWDHLWSWINF